MSLLSPYDYDPVSGTPVKGSVDWLWYKPATETSLSPDTLFASYHNVCKRCDTYGVKDPQAAKPRCWCCGRFVASPTASYNFKKFTWGPSR